MPPRGDTWGVASTSIIGSILAWLSAGYPDGVPPTDRFPLLALLRRTLTEDQVHEVVAKLVEAKSPPGGDTNGAHGAAVTKDEIEAFIANVTRDEPTDKDIARVASRLAAGGWPLAGLDAPVTNG